MQRVLITRLAVITGLALAVTGVAAVLPHAIGDGGSPTATSSSTGFVQSASPTSLSGQLRALGDHLEQQPKDATGWALLAQGYVEQARITSDASLYARADMAIARSLALRPEDNADALAARAALDSALHDFKGALDAARASLHVNPLNAVALAIRTDTLTELGKYNQALHSARQMDQQRPGLPATTRLAYQSELRGDATRAKAYFRTAAKHATGTDQAFALVHLADLVRASGNLAMSRSLYRQAMHVTGEHAAASVGLARLHAANGDRDRAIAIMQQVTSATPLPEYLTYLGELLLVDGQQGAAHAQFDVVTGAAELAEQQGVNVDLELSLFLADHGSATEALHIAQRSWRERQTVHTADALGWALHRVGRDRQALIKLRFATALGFAPPAFMHHLGSVEAALGHNLAAQRDLRAALTSDPGYSPWQRAQVRTELQRLERAS